MSTQDYFNALVKERDILTKIISARLVNPDAGLSLNSAEAIGRLVYARNSIDALIRKKSCS